MSNRLVIRGGWVHDGLGRPGRHADVLIEDDRVVAIGERQSHHDALILDAAGLAVAPGFVNVLSQAHFSLLADGRGLSDLYQGVTTQVFGEGVSVGPFTPESKAAMSALMGPAHGPYPRRLDWDRLSEFLSALASQGVAQNVASFVGAHNLRLIAAGESDRPAPAVDLSYAMGVLEEEMQDGALGLGSALIYPPGYFATTDEITALCEVVARHDGMYISHLRSEGDRLIEAVDELIEIGRRAEVSTEIYHLKAMGHDNWSKLDRAIERIEAARTRGQPVTADVYPYLAGQTRLVACVPPAFLDRGPGALAARLADPRERHRIRQSIVRRSDRWENLYLASGGADGIVLQPSTDGPLARYRGRTLQYVAEQRGGEDPAETLLTLVEQEPALHATYFMMHEDGLRSALGRPWVSIGSDAATYAAEPPYSAVATHPRAYGTFARVLGVHTREQSLLSLEEAVYRMAGLPAQNLGLRDRGLITPGGYADLVVFDPDSISDHATYEDPHQYSQGVRHVVVNGVPAVVDGTPTGKLAGRALSRGH